MHLTLCCDEAYVEHAGVLLHSVFRQHPGLPMTVHLLRPQAFDTALLARLDAFVRTAGSLLVDHPVPQAWINAIPESPSYPKAAWLKIFAPALVPVPRALYLDIDMLVRDSLLPVWQIDLGTACLAAVQEPIGEYSLQGLHAHVPTLGLPSLESYFNTGIMLFDLDRMRSDGIVELLRAYAGDPGQPKTLVDQDAYNHVIAGAWKPLPLRYNAAIPIYLYDRYDVPLPAHALHEALLEPAVVHFCSPDKPWKPGCFHPYVGEYRQCRRESGWGRRDDVKLDAATALVQHLPLRLRIGWYRALNPWVGQRPQLHQWLGRLKATGSRGYRRLARTWRAS